MPEKSPQKRAEQLLAERGPTSAGAYAYRQYRCAYPGWSRECRYWIEVLECLRGLRAERGV